MIIRLLGYARRNAIAGVALVISILALGGGAYAALSLPPHSVGALQIRNHSIGQVKFDPRTVGGVVRHWAAVDAKGNIVSSSSRARDTGVPLDGDYLVTWSDNFPGRCIPVATVVGSAGLLSPAAGFANARVTGSHPTRVWVSTYNAQGAPTPAAFSLAVIC